MFTSTKPYRQELENGLVLKSIANMGDVVRLAAFNTIIFDENECLRNDRNYWKQGFMLPTSMTYIVLNPYNYEMRRKRMLSLLTTAISFFP